MMKKHIPMLIRIIVAIILLQTLRFKFFSHPDSIYIFTQVGLEPVWRIVIGFIELIAGILILIPSTAVFGALISSVILIGAIFMHLTNLGIEVQGDGWLLFVTAIVTFILSLLIIWFDRKRLLFWKK